MHVASRHKSTAYGQALYLGRKAIPATQMGAKTGTRSAHAAPPSKKAAYRACSGPSSAPVAAAVPAPVPAPASDVQYLSAGQSWCFFSRQQQAILEDPENQKKTSVRYVDCSQGGPNVGHPVCNITPKPSGFPYLAKCSGKHCSVLAPGRRSVEDLNKHLALDQQQQ